MSFLDGPDSPISDNPQERVSYSGAPFAGSQGTQAQYGGVGSFLSGLFDGLFDFTPSNVLGGIGLTLGGPLAGAIGRGIGGMFDNASFSSLDTSRTNIDALGHYGSNLGNISGLPGFFGGPAQGSGQFGSFGSFGSFGNPFNVPGVDTSQEQRFAPQIQAVVAANPGASPAQIAQILREKGIVDLVPLQGNYPGLAPFLAGAGGAAGGAAAGGAANPLRFSADNPLIPLIGLPGSSGGAPVNNQIDSPLFGQTSSSGGNSPFKFTGTFGEINVDPATGSVTMGLPALNALRAERRAATENQASFLESQAAKFDLKPLSSAISEKFGSQRLRLENAKLKAVSNARSQFERNKLGGSSFAEREIGSLEAEFGLAENELGKEESLAVANTTLQELEIKTKLVDQANALRLNTVKEDITNAYGETLFATQLSGLFAELFEKSRQVQMQLAVSEAQSIRNAIFGIQQANISAASAAERTRSVIDFEKEKSIGSGLASIFSKPAEKLVENIFGKLFKF